LSLTIHTDSAASKSIMWRQRSLSRSESPGCELVLSGRRTSSTPAYQPANLARDPIGSGEGRRNTTNSERRSPAPEHAEHHKSLGDARFGRHEAAGGVERAGVEEEAKAHAHREVDRRICGPPAQRTSSRRRAAEARARTRDCGPCSTAETRPGRRRRPAGRGSRRRAGHGSNPRPGDDYSISSSRRSLP
jgi:hypothetical protein